MRVTPMVFVGLGLAWSIGALAADPVLYVGDADAAVKRLVAATKRPAADFAPIALSDLLADVDPFFTETRVRFPCEGQPQTSEALLESVESLEAQLAEGIIAESETLSELTFTSLACLEEPADPTVVARLLIVRGVVAMEAGDDVAAEESIIAAHGFDPAVEWAPGMSEDARMLYERAPMVVAMEKPVVVSWEPAVESPDVLLDGSEVSGLEAQVPPGIHLAQVGTDPTRSALAELEGSTTRLVLPQLLVEDAAALVTDEARRALLTGVLVQVLDPDVTVYVVTDAGMLKGIPSRNEWGGLEDVLPGEQPGPDEPKTRTDGQWSTMLTAGVAAVAIGGAAVVGGGVLAGVSDARARSFAEERTRASKCKCHRAIRWRTVGQGIAAGGAVVLLTGASIAVMEPIADERAGPLVVGLSGRW